MKQKFTLIALAFVASSAFAANSPWRVEAEDGQEKILFENGTTIVDEQEFTTENMTLKLGKDIKKAAGWDVKATNSSEFLAPFTQTVQIQNSDTGEMEDKERIVYISGGNNPKDDLLNKGGGFNGSGEKGKLPQSGTYYIITPKLDGSMSVGVILNGDKEFFIVDATDAVQTPVLNDDGEETGNYTMNVINADAVFTHDMFKVYNIDGVEQPYQDAEGEDCIFDGGKGGVKVQNKLTGTVEFDVQANHTYYVFCTGSKLGCFGFILTPTGSSVEETYAVNINSEHGQVILDKSSYKEGEKVYADVIADTGYEMAGISIINDTTGEEITPVTEENGEEEKHYFVMPASSVTITVTYEKLYKVTLTDTQNGSVTVISVNMESNPYSKKDKRICMMVTPQDGYEIQEVAIKSADNQSVEVRAETGVDHGQEFNYFFIMPENDVTITATFQVIDGINVVTTDTLNGKWFNLQGVEVKNTVKGVYIQNGKKVILK
ncbi:MAG: hypothetical protein IKX36_06370 [Prevotella sp.]|nr:hypothetical protein [Prevotella sp.]